MLLALAKPHHQLVMGKENQWKVPISINKKKSQVGSLNKIKKMFLKDCLFYRAESKLNKLRKELFETLI